MFLTFLGNVFFFFLDMLSVDDSPAAFLQNSIKNDHCYTNLLPSSDPNGPSFFMNDTRMTSNGETSKGKGKVIVYLFIYLYKFFLFKLIFI